MKGFVLHFFGNIVLDKSVAEKIMTPEKMIEQEHLYDMYNLTEKEISIIRLIANGLNNKEISKELFLSEGTIKNNITNILGKLELRDRTQLAIFAFKNKIVIE